MSLEEQLAAMPSRAKGKAQLRRNIREAKRKLASCTLLGQLQWIINNEKLLSSYRDAWLTNKAAIELDYPIFFAVSENGGKDSSGEPIYKPGNNGELMQDEHGHLIVKHDLDDIAESFKAFASEQGFDFWS